MGNFLNTFGAFRLRRHFFEFALYCLTRIVEVIYCLPYIEYKATHPKEQCIKDICDNMLIYIMIYDGIDKNTQINE